MHSLPGRSLLLPVVALFVLAIASTADAQRPQAGGQGGARGFPAGLAEARLVKEKAEHIGVGEETLKKLDALVEETRAQEHELRERMKVATKGVEALLDTGRPDEKAVLEASKAGTQIAGETRVLRLQFSLKVRALMTDEQLAKFMEIRKKAMGARRKGGRRPRGG